MRTGDEKKLARVKKVLQKKSLWMRV